MSVLARTSGEIMRKPQNPGVTTLHSTDVVAKPDSNNTWRGTYAEALQLIAGLSSPSKMPWYGWSISAKSCITGGRLVDVEGSVCHGCYALKGRYLFPNVQSALDRRGSAWQHPDFVPAFIFVLERLYERTRKRLATGERENRFRWFDSGDLQSVEMLDKIVQIARGTPYVRHWVPTREWQIVRAYEGELPANLVVRLSIAKVGSAPNRQPFGLPFATVGADHKEELHQCPALTEQGNRCLDCDACWRPINVNYKKH